jgi:uncharacterized protein (TIGR02145 family)
MNCEIKISRITFPFLITILLFTSCNKATLPTVKTVAVNRIQQTNVYSGGRVTSDGDAPIVEVGVCWSTTTGPTTDDNKLTDSVEAVSFTVHITGLTPNTLYYLKAFAINSEGTGYGDEVSFTTAQVDLPAVTTAGLKSLTLTSASGGGDVTNDGGLTVTERGVCWNTSPGPAITDNHTNDGTGTGSFSSILTDLAIGTTYFVRAYATNSLGTTYGNQLEYKQIEPVTDNDGNAYSVVTIGTQVWMGENLRVTTFKDGLSIPYVTDGRTWANLTTPALSWYNNDESTFKSTYGAIYNWYAVNSGKLCPVGWHVPSVDDFTALVAYLGGQGIAGGKMKEAGTTHWNEPNVGATNGSGFTALPGGGRYNLHSDPGVFLDLGYGTYIWSATESTNDVMAYSYDLVFDKEVITKNEYSKKDGGSVRCVKDPE